MGDIADNNDNNAKIIKGPETNIMNPYKNMNPKYELLHYKTNNNISKSLKHQRILKVILDNDVELVLKHMRFRPNDEHIIRQVHREYRIGKLLGPVTEGATYSIDMQEKKDDEDTVVEILMEYAGDPLNEIIEKEMIKRGDSFKIMLQLLNTLTLMEKIGMSHLDIKPQNIAWHKKTNKVKLIDFGTSSLFYGTKNRVLDKVSKEKLTGFTKQYAAPEIKNETKNVIFQKLDVFALGITFIKLLISEYEIENPIKYKEGGFIDWIDINKMTEKLPELKGIQELIGNMLQTSPEDRPSFTELRISFLKFLNETGNVKIEEEAKDESLDALIHLEECIRTGSNVDNKNLLTDYGSANLVKMYRRFGLLFQVMENNNMGIESYNKAIEIYLKNEIKIDPMIDPMLAHLYENLGELYTEIGNFKEAINCTINALNIMLRIHGELGPDTVALYNRLGLIYGEMGYYKTAEKYCTKVLDIRLNVYGEYNLRTANSYISLGNIYNKMGNHSKALEYCEKGLNIELKLRKKFNFETGFVYNRLGLICSKMGNITRSKDYLNIALEIMLKVFGEQHSNTALIYNSLGIFYFQKGQYKEAEENFNKALNILSDDQCPFIAAIYNNLGGIYHKIKDNVKAKECFEKSLSIKLKIYGEQHLLIAHSYNNI